MTARSQKRKTLAELGSGEFEASSAENNQTENYVAGPCKSPKIKSEKPNENKTALREKILSDLIRILAENQEEMLKLLAPAVKKPITLQNLENSGSEPENVLPITTSTPIKKSTTFNITL